LPTCPIPKIKRLGRTLKQWRQSFLAYIVTGRANNGGPEAISFAFVSIIRDTREIHTMGMQVLGFPDLLLRASDIDERGEDLIEIIRYVCTSDRPFDVGHILADEHGPRFHIISRESDSFHTRSAMHNPNGRLKFISAKEFVEGN